MAKKKGFFHKELVTGGPYTPAIAVGDLVFIAGQGPISHETRKITGSTLEEQLELTFRNVEKALESAGCTLDDCVKVNAYLSDLANFGRYNEIYKTKFSQPYPARTTVQAVLAQPMMIEIDAVAVRGSGGKSKTKAKSKAKVKKSKKK